MFLYYFHHFVKKEKDKKSLLIADVCKIKSNFTRKKVVMILKVCFCSLNLIMTKKLEEFRQEICTQLQEICTQLQPFKMYCNGANVQ